MQPLDKVFRCLFCQHAGVVHCKLDRQEMLSRIECSKCKQHFETKIDHLTEPIDVYSLWIDAAEAANDSSQLPQDDSHEPPSPTIRPSSKHSSATQHRPRAEERYDDGLDEPDGELPDNIF